MNNSSARPQDQPLDGQAPGSAIEPLAPLFLAQDRRPGGLAVVPPEELAPLQRALLAIDGTVTTFLAAWALEAVDVIPIRQRTTVLAPAALTPVEAWLDAPAGTPVVERAVLLIGVRSKRLFAYAESVICLERLPAPLRSALLTGGLSVGQLLLMPGFESRREGLWYGRERPATLPPAVAELTAPDFLTRTYRVSAASRPLMLITERFPWSLRE